MSYIVQRQNRYYVVADGHDPFTGRERRRWHPIGHDSHKAEQLAARLDRERSAAPAAPPVGSTTFGGYLTAAGMPHKRRQVPATTAYRYAWFIERYIQPTLGDIPLRRLRADHLDGFYDNLGVTAGRDGTGLAPKTVLEVHAVIRAALDHAGEGTSSTATLPPHTKPPSAGRQQRRPLLDPPRSSTPHGRGAATLPCASLRTPACDAARSSGSSGTTSASPAPDFR